MLEIVLALAAALCYSIATIIQHRVAAAVPAESGGTLRLFGRLLRNRLWLFGKAMDFVALGLQAIALAHGSLTVVQAMLSASIVLTLWLSAFIEHRALTARQWAGSAIVGLGLSLFVAIGDPGGGRSHGSGGRWIAVLLTYALVLLIASRVAADTSRPHAGVALSFATAASFALDGAALKAAAEIVQHNGWTLRAVVALAGYIAAAIVGNVLLQRAFQLAPLRTTVPVVTAGQPVIGLALGAVLFHEGFQAEGLRQGFGWGGIVVLMVGCVMTARSRPATTVVHHGIV